MIDKLIKLKSIFFNNEYIKTFVKFLTIAIIIVFTLFGSYGLFKNYEIPYSSISICFLMLSLFFILSFEFFKHKTENILSCLTYSLFLSFLLTFILTSMSESFKMTFYGTFWKIGVTFDIAIICVSISMILSVIICTVIQYVLFIKRE